jgi:hypothetical protein
MFNKQSIFTEYNGGKRTENYIIIQGAGGN